MEDRRPSAAPPGRARRGGVRSAGGAGGPRVRLPRALPRPAAVADPRAGGGRRSARSGRRTSPATTSSTAPASTTSPASSSTGSRSTRTTPRTLRWIATGFGIVTVGGHLPPLPPGTQPHGAGRAGRRLAVPRWCGRRSPAMRAPAPSGARTTGTYPAGSLTRNPRPPVSSGSPRSTPCTDRVGIRPVTVHRPAANTGQVRCRTRRRQHVQHRRERLLRHLDLEGADRLALARTRLTAGPAAAPSR